MMGSFDDMLAKTAERDEARGAAKVASRAAPASDGGGSLASQMFGTVKNLFGKDEEEEPGVVETTAASAPSAAMDAAAREVADIDARAQTGELSFNDFLTLSEAFSGLGEDKQLPGMPTLSAKQMLETREKFEKH